MLAPTLHQQWTELRGHKAASGEGVLPPPGCPEFGPVDKPQAVGKLTGWDSRIRGPWAATPDVKGLSACTPAAPLGEPAGGVISPPVLASLGFRGSHLSMQRPPGLRG